MVKRIPINIKYEYFLNIKENLKIIQGKFSANVSVNKWLEIALKQKNAFFMKLKIKSIGYTLGMA